MNLLGLRAQLGMGEHRFVCEANNAPASGQTMSQQNANSRLFLIAAASGLLLAASCTRWSVPSSLVGTWSGTQKVTVRVGQPRGPNRFVSDTVAIALSVRADGSVEGHVGGATLAGAYVLRNRGRFDFRLEGRLQGALFSGDPIPTMDIHAPFGVANDTLAGSLFQQSGMGVYPMVDFRLTRPKE
jgi:hypothetical protein